MRIPRSLIQTFLTRKHLKNVVAFLTYVKKPSNEKEFKNFAKKKGYQLSSIENTKPYILFHGGQNFNKMLKPSPSEKLIYATSNPNYAIFLAVIDLQKGGNAGVLSNPKKTKLTIDTSFVNGPSALKILKKQAIKNMFQNILQTSFLQFL